MYKRFQTENLYVTKLTQTMNPIGDIGDPKEVFSLYVSQMPKYSKGFVMVDFTSIDRKDVIRFHDVDTNTNELKYYRCNRDLLNSGAIDLSHAINAVVQINDVAEWFNYLFSNVDDFGMIETLGNNNVNVAGGRVFINDAYVTVADLVTTALANGTYTAILDYSDNTLKLLTSVVGISGIELGQVVIATGVDPVVTDFRGYNAPLKYDADIFQIVDGELKLISGVAISQATEGSVGSTRLGTLTDHSSATTGAVVVQTKNLVKTSAGAGDENKVPILGTNGKLSQSLLPGIYGEDTGGDDAYVVALVPPLASYITGERYYAKVTTANTGACTFDFGPGAKSVKTLDGNDPQTGAIRAGMIVEMIYNGTNLIMQNEDFATDAVKGTVEMATDAEATTGTDETRYINPKQLKARSFNDFLTVSENLKSSADTQVLANPGNTWIKYKEIRINCFGAVRVKFEVRGRDLGGYSTSCQVYINGIAVGVQGTGLTPGVWETALSQDFTVKANDLVQLYMNTPNTGGGNGGLRNFRVFYNVTKIENSTVIQN